MKPVPLATQFVLCTALLTSAAAPPNAPLVSEGAIVRGSTQTKKLALVFTGHEFAEGARPILDALARHHAQASFFLTGDFLRNPKFAPIIRRIVDEHHYIGPHSDKHLLYCAWEKPARTLVTRDQFRADLEANLHELRQFGALRSQTRYFLPPYEHYNRQIADWTAEAGLTLINFTAGTRSNADYTSEAETNFVSSEKIFTSIIAREQQPDGLNGFLLLLHIGAGPGRADKFHARFGELLDQLSKKNYRFVRVDELFN